MYKSSVIGRGLTPSRIRETWEKMRPENRYGQMTPKERVAFALSEEGKNYLFPWGFTVDGKRYEKMVSGRVARVFDEESRVTEQSYSREECSHIFRTAFLLFAGYVDAATSFAQNCGGGGSAPDKDWGGVTRTRRHPLGPPLLPQSEGDGYHAGEEAGDEEIASKLVELPRMPWQFNYSS